jgi:hypothetical protein
MAIDDIIQIKDTVSKEGIIPLDKNQDVMNAKNQVDFLRTQKEMGLSENAVMAKLIQMFVEEPTKFTQEFGKESAESIREFLGFKTQGDMEEEGYVFEDDTSKIIGQNISFRPPEDSAIGTLTTDQSEKFEDPALLERLGINRFSRAIAERLRIQSLLERLKHPIDKLKDIPFIEKFIQEKLAEDNALDPSLPVAEQELEERLRTQSLLERLAIQDNALNPRLPVAEQGLESDIMMEELKKQLDFIPDALNPRLPVTENIRILTEDEAESMGLSTEEGKTYKMNKDTGNISIKERWLTQEEVKERGLPYTDGQIYILDTETQEITRKEPKGIEKIILDVMDWFKYGRQDPENRDYK